jgi:transposase
MRPRGSAQELARRRLRAIELLESGNTYRQVAEIFDASLSSVVGWAKAYRKKGVDGLKPKAVSGRPPELTDKPKLRLEKILLKGPLKAGYSTDLWTVKRIAEVITARFEVNYHPGHVWKIMKALGWSCQKPERRAMQRDEEAIRKWKRYKWPQIKKSPNTWCPPGFP